MKKLSIIIPVYNEDSTLLEILSRVIASPLKGMEKEILIIDDCSTDKTAMLIDDLKKDWKKFFSGKTSPDEKEKTPREPSFVFLKNDENSGKGFSIRRGLDTSTGDYILIQDADLEYNPFEYPRLLEPILDGRADVVYGSRFLGETRRVLYFWHSIANKFLTTFSNIFTDLNMSDMETCYKVFRADMIKKIRLESNRFGFEPEVTAKLAKLKARFYEVPISYSGRTYEQGKKITWKDGFNAIFAILKYNLTGDYLKKTDV